MLRLRLVSRARHILLLGHHAVVAAAMLLGHTLLLPLLFSQTRRCSNTNNDNNHDDYHASTSDNAWGLDYAMLYFLLAGNEGHLLHVDVSSDGDAAALLHSITGLLQCHDVHLLFFGPGSVPDAVLFHVFSIATRRFCEDRHQVLLVLVLVLFVLINVVVSVIFVYRRESQLLRKNRLPARQLLCSVRLPAAVATVLLPFLSYDVTPV